MIQEACTYVEKTPNLDVKLKLIDTLRTVTDGKVGDRISCYIWRGNIFYFIYLVDSVLRNNMNVCGF